MLRVHLKERTTYSYRIVSIDNGAARKAAAMRIRRVTDIPINKAVPRIHHVGIRPGRKKRPDIMQAACDNLHISGQARRLLAFYADQADGFTPALELIHKKTGLDRKDISKIRKQLVDNGIEFDCIRPLTRIRYTLSVEEQRLHRQGACLVVLEKSLRRRSNTCWRSTNTRRRHLSGKSMSLRVDSTRYLRT